MCGYTGQAWQTIVKVEAKSRWREGKILKQQRTLGRQGVIEHLNVEQSLKNGTVLLYKRKDEKSLCKNSNLTQNYCPKPEAGVHHRQGKKEGRSPQTVVVE